MTPDEGWFIHKLAIAKVIVAPDGGSATSAPEVYGY